MRESVFEGGGLYSLFAPSPKWAARGSQKDAGDVLGGATDVRPRRVVALEALEDGGVFAVDRKDARACLAGEAGDGLAGSDQDFLRGEGDVLAGAQGGGRRANPGCADDGDDHDVGIVDGGKGFKIVIFAAEDAIRRKAEAGTYLLEALMVATGGDADDPQPIGQSMDDVDGLRADASGGAQNDDVLH